MKVIGLPGVEVFIRVNSLALPEFQDEGDDRRTQFKGVKYVEVPSSSNFSVHVQTDRTKLGGNHRDHMFCNILLDGTVVHRPLLDPYSRPQYRCDMLGHRGEIDGTLMFQKFTFADLNTHDGAVEGLKVADFKQLGEVEVQLGFCRKLREEARLQAMPSMSNESIPEKCLKGRAMSNRASLGNPEPWFGSRMAFIVDFYKGQTPAANYVFKYRSKKDLQIEGIIPRSPSPVPLEERDPEDLSPEEAHELIRRMRTQRSDDNVKIKKEKRGRATEDDDEDSDEEVTIIEQRNSKRVRLSADSGVEVVDLTDD